MRARVDEGLSLAMIVPAYKGQEHNRYSALSSGPFKTSGYLAQALEIKYHQVRTNNGDGVRKTGERTTHRKHTRSD